MFYCELLSGIWIGDTDILVNDRFIKDNNIDIILNCTQMFNFPELDLYKKVRLPFSPVRESDSDIYLIRENYKKIVTFLTENIDVHNILICCYDGKSISPFIVALYIAEYSNVDKKSIYNILLTKDSNLSLWYDLSLFYNT